MNKDIVSMAFGVKGHVRLRPLGAVICSITRLSESVLNAIVQRLLSLLSLQAAASAMYMPEGDLLLVVRYYRAGFL